MGNNKILKAVILIAVITAAAFIVYPKISGNTQALQSGSATGAQGQSATPKEVALEKALKSGKPTMVFYHTTYCDTCKDMVAILAEAKEELGDRVNFIDVLVDIPTDSGLVGKYNVTRVPTSVFFYRDGKTAGQYVGPFNKADLMQVLTDLER